ncbi:hypothetical protein [Ensifer soli]|uniref:hypothetical protein n=1 Tax=Ciceribacter sp. sgz301302 TaxID=3342379 RepID=UPI0035B9D1C5
MVDEDFWRTVQEKDLVAAQSRRTGALNLALLFGTAVIALSLILTPMLSSKDDSLFARAPLAYDDVVTGSVPKDSGKTYTIRRSILEETPGAVCIIDGEGNSSGC